MASATLTIRLRSSEREILGRAAREQGVGLSAFVRKLAEREARNLRDEEIRAGFAPVVANLHDDAKAAAELNAWSDLGLEVWEQYDDDPREWAAALIEQAEHLDQKRPAG